MLQSGLTNIKNIVSLHIGVSLCSRFTGLIIITGLRKAKQDVYVIVCVFLPKYLKIGFTYCHHIHTKTSIGHLKLIKFCDKDDQNCLNQIYTWLKFYFADGQRHSVTQLISHFIEKGPQGIRKLTTHSLGQAIPLAPQVLTEAFKDYLEQSSNHFPYPMKALMVYPK